MAKQKPFVTGEQWIRLEPWRPKMDESSEATGKCLTALSGHCGVVTDGTIYLIDIHQLVLAGQDDSNGKSKVFG